MRPFTTPRASRCDLCTALGLLGSMAVFVLLPVAARADDETFRELPLQAAPSPQELVRRLSQIPLHPPAGAEGASALRNLPSLDAAPPHVKEMLKNLASGANGEEGEPSQGLRSPQFDPAAVAPRNGQPAPATVPSPPRESPRSAPHADPSIDRRSATAPANEHSERPRDSSAGGPATMPQPRRDDGASAPRRIEKDRTTRPEGGSPLPPGVRQPLAEPPDDALPPRMPLENDRTRAPSLTPPPPRPSPPTAESPRPTLRSRKEFNDKLNRILLDAARRAAQEEPSQASLAASASRDSILKPLVNRAEKLLAEHGNRGDFGNWSPRGLGRNRGRSWLRGFDWSVSLPGGSGGSFGSRVSGSFMWLAAPILLALAAALFAPLASRLRPRVAARWRAARSLTEFSSLRIASREDLVQAVDRLVTRRFGKASHWWHCRAVERALTSLQPEMRSDIAELVATYQVSRYGPHSQPVPARQLEQSAETLRRLAEGLFSADRAPLSIASAA